MRVHLKPQPCTMQQDATNVQIEVVASCCSRQRTIVPAGGSCCIDCWIEQAAHTRPLLHCVAVHSGVSVKCL